MELRDLSGVSPASSLLTQEMQVRIPVLTADDPCNNEDKSLISSALMDVLTG